MLSFLSKMLPWQQQKMVLSLYAHEYGIHSEQRRGISIQAGQILSPPLSCAGEGGCKVLVLIQHLKRQTQDHYVVNVGCIWRGYPELTRRWGLWAACQAQHSFSNLIFAAPISQQAPRASANGSAEATRSNLLKSFQIALLDFRADSKPGGIFHFVSILPNRNSPTFFWLWFYITNKNDR